jgi:hypothetical protein
LIKLKAKGIGGCIIWHLGEDVLTSGKQPLAEVAAGFLRGEAGVR